MYQDLVTLPQESFSWLTRFAGSPLSRNNRDLVELINQNIDNGNFNEVNRLIGVLQERAQTTADALESAEIFAETGLARFRMREYLLAIQDLNGTVLRSPVDSHHQACAYWLLGTVQFWIENQRAAALRNWEKGQADFLRLAQAADRNNRAVERRWYRDRAAYMQAAMTGKIQEFFS
jgi:hypothetical protein